MKATVTICSDASLSDPHKIATWAAFIRTPTETIKSGGIIREYTVTSNEAERCGIANALHIVNRKVDLTKCHLIIYCDNIQALTPVIKPTKNSPQLKPIAERMNRLYAVHIKPYVEMAASYEFKHVKGHLKRREWTERAGSNFMNDWCDQEARKLLREAVAARKEKLHDVQSQIIYLRGQAGGS